MFTKTEIKNVKEAYNFLKEHAYLVSIIKAIEVLEYEQNNNQVIDQDEEFNELFSYMIEQLNDYLNHDEVTFMNEHHNEVFNRFVEEMWYFFNDLDPDDLVSSNAKELTEALDLAAEILTKKSEA